jgi:succinate dehydrogenase / fumarate reductase, flavoprotein subunit
MPALKSLGEVHATDILIIGGGAAGLSAAITAKEAAPELDILIVDKATASKGWAGKSARTAGLLSFVTEQDDPEAFVKYCLENIGFYLNDQILLREYAFSSRPVVERLSAWGVDVPRREDGIIDYAKWPFPWGTASIDPDMCQSMARYAVKLGVRIIDKVVVADLLKDDGRVSGAVAFNIIDGAFHIFKAGTIILANGSQNYDMTLTWCATGNGTAAAYRAGAEMRNAEFGNMCDFARVDPRGWVITAGAHTAHDYLYAKGENISQKYRPGLHSSMDPIAALAWYKETLAGNGPIMAHLDAFAAESAKFFKFHPKAREQQVRRAKKTQPPDSQRFEVIPGFIGELSCVRVDHQMETTIPGLFAVGDVSGSGSARAGAVPTPPAKIHGTGLLNAFFMGMKGGPAATIHAKALKAYGIEGKAGYRQVAALKEKVFKPLTRTSGISPHDIIRKIQDVIAPADRSIIKSEARMKKALDELVALREDVNRMKARDCHELAKCVDAESMALCAEIFYRASLMRTESRGFHYREDYPEMDNKDWLKWIIIRDEKGAMKVGTENIPIEQYPYKPV